MSRVRLVLLAFCFCVATLLVAAPPGGPGVPAQDKAETFDLSVPLLPKERLLLEKAAKAAGMDVDDWARDVLLKAAKQQVKAKK